MKKRLPSVEHVETLSLLAMRRLVGGLVEELQALKAEVATLRSENEALREDNAQLRLDNARLKAENQQLRDEIARLKNLPPRPPFRPSGMEKATEPGNGDRAAGKSPRGPKRDTNRITRTVTLRADAPEGSRFKGYKSFFVRDLVLAAELVNYRRERWLTPEGKVLIAPLPEGVSSGFGRNLRRACLALHAQGQVTTPRLTAILNSIGVEISKRQVVRLLTTDLEQFVEEDSAVLHAGLVSAPFITVDDTGARHNRRNAFTTQIGGERFSTFRTSLSKSRLNFLSVLRAGHQGYVLNDEAMNWLKAQGVEHAIMTKLQINRPAIFADQAAFLEHLVSKGIDILDRQLLRPVAEAAIWGGDPPPWTARQHGDRFGRCGPVPCRQPRPVLGAHGTPAAEIDAGDTERGTAGHDDPRSGLALLQGAEGLETTAFTAVDQRVSAQVRANIRATYRLCGARQAALAPPSTKG